MAKTFNLEIVEKEFDKLNLDGQMEMYQTLGTLIHNKIVTHQEQLAQELNKFQAHKDKLNGK